MIKQMCAKNRERLAKNLQGKLGDLGNAWVLMKGSYTFNENDSDTYYAQPAYEPNFVYLFGLERMYVDGAFNLKSQESILIINKEPDVYSQDFIRDKIHEQNGIDKTLTKKQFIEHLNNDNIDKIFLHCGIDSYTQTISNVYDDEDVLTLFNDKIDRDSLYPILNNQRVIKNDIEIELMRDICQISSKAHIEIMKQCKPGMFEYQIAAIFFQKCNEYNVDRWAYWPICGSGTDCSILHYVDNDKQLKDGDLLLCDLGGKKNGICSDITTTFPVNGKFTEKQKQIYDIVLEGQLAAIKEIRPMTNYSMCMLAASKVMLQGLIDIELLQGDIDEMLNERIIYYFMPHSLGHYIGFKTHDVGLQRIIPDCSQIENVTKNMFKQYTSISMANMRPGMVTTVEPGIYFIRAKLDSAKNKKNIKQYYEIGGVRIEDCVLITQEGHEVLTKCPRQTEEIEKCMKGENWEQLIQKSIMRYVLNQIIKIKYKAQKL